MNRRTDYALARGELLFMRKRYEQALQEFLAILTLNSKNCEAMAMVSFCHAHLRRFPSARQAAHDAIAIDPLNAEGYYALAWLLHIDYQFASACPGEVTMRDSRLDKTHKRLRLAGSACAQALEIAPRDARLLLLNSVICHNRLKFADALQAANDALAIAPTSADVQRLRARILALLGDATAAREAMARAFLLEPNNAQSHAAAGWISLSAYDLPAAREHFLEALRLDPLPPDARKGLLLALRATFWFYRPFLRVTMPLQKYLGTAIVGPMVILYVGVTLFLLYYGLGLFECDPFDLYFDGFTFVPPHHPAALVIGGSAITVFLALAAAWSIGNFLLLFHPIGRAILTRPQIIASTLVTGLIFSVVICTAVFAYVPAVEVRHLKTLAILAFFAVGAGLFIVAGLAVRRTLPLSQPCPPASQ
jgi:Flp pilus assembly protein TadD